MSQPSLNYRYIVIFLVLICLVILLITQSSLNDGNEISNKIPTPQPQENKEQGLKLYNSFGIPISPLQGEAFLPETTVTSSKPKILSEPSKTETNVNVNVPKYLQNVPETPYILGGGKFPKFFNTSCATFPHLDRIHFNNGYWQMERAENLTYYLLNAFLDVRELNPNAPEVRILSMVDNLFPDTQEQCEQTFCQFWYLNESAPLIVPARQCLRIWKDNWGKNSRYVGALISCPLPESDELIVPTSVSLVQNACDSATNNLALIFQNRTEENEPSSSHRFGVCVKGLNFLEERDKPVRLVEWVEFLGLMGIDKIFLYEFATHPKIKEVLNYYEKLGRIEVIPITLPGTLPNEDNLRNFYISAKNHLTEKRKNEVITYNDCLYRNMYRYDFLALLDTDEILVPINNTSLKELFSGKKIDDALHDGVTTTFCFRQLHFFGDLTDPEIPSKYPMLQHVYRDVNITRPGAAVKCIHRTDRTQTLHNHFPFSCVEKCKVYNFNPDEEGRMQHYRPATKVDDFLNSKECANKSWEECRDYLTSVDKTLWKWMDLLGPRVDEAIKELGLLVS